MNVMSKTNLVLRFFLSLALNAVAIQSWTMHPPNTIIGRSVPVSTLTSTTLSAIRHDRGENGVIDDSSMHHRQMTNRRQLFQSAVGTASLGLLSSLIGTNTMMVPPSYAEETATSPAAEVTDKIFVEIKGLPSEEGATSTTKRIVIGLFGKKAPQSVNKLKQLVSSAGLPSACKPREERVLQREQLEANKVYNSCIETQDKGVNYDYAQIWRVIRGERLDFGAVAGKFVARESPSWEENEKEAAAALKHDRPGLVSVRRGADSGFGFTIYPGGDDNKNADVVDLNDNHIIVGQVLEGLDVVEQINNIPVITSSKVNYMQLTGGPTTKSAPSRSCRYGGNMYCNENKPLVKLTMYRTGVL